MPDIHDLCPDCGSDRAEGLDCCRIAGGRPIDYLASLNHSPFLLEATRRAFERGRALGEFVERDGPVGTEDVVWIGDEAFPRAWATFCEIGHDRIWLDLLWVEPAARRQGLGSSLVAAVIDRARGRTKRVMLGTQIGNAKMIALCAKASLDLSGVTYEALTRVEVPHVIEP